LGSESVTFVPISALFEPPAEWVSENEKNLSGFPSSKWTCLTPERVFGDVDHCGLPFLPYKKLNSPAGLRLGHISFGQMRKWDISLVEKSARKQVTHPTSSPKETYVGKGAKDCPTLVDLGPKKSPNICGFLVSVL